MDNHDTNTLTKGESSKVCTRCVSVNDTVKTIVNWTADTNRGTRINETSDTNKRKF